jgi:exodeoxyribonuclease VII small subunit
MAQKQFKDFESTLAALEAKVKALEEGNLPLEEALKVFEEGMALAETCSAKLQEAEQKVEVLLKSADGKARRAPFGGDRPADGAGDSDAADAADDEDVPS